MKTTSYFTNSVMARRPYLKEEWITSVINAPVRKVTQPNGRIGYWGFVAELNKYLRVVTEADGEPVHNAFPDRGFRL